MEICQKKKETDRRESIVIDEARGKSDSYNFEFKKTAK